MIFAENTMDAWKRALTAIKQDGRRFTDNERRECAELTNFSVTVKTLADVNVPLQWIRANGEWLYPSDDELKDMLFRRDAEEGPRYAYGSRIFSFRGQLDQLDGFVIPLLRKSPESRRALVILADPVADEVVVSHNFVSLISLWFRIVDGALCVTATIRSNDFFLGWPANAFQVSALQSYVADHLGVPVGAVTTISFSAHYFMEDDALVEKLLKRQS